MSVETPIREGQTLTGPQFDEPMQVETVRANGVGVWVAEDRPDCFWLYVVTNCANEPELQEPIKDPARFPWHEVKKVAHYYLSVNALSRATNCPE